MKQYLSIILFFFTTILLAQMPKVEPPFWWSGMKNSSLQLLCYGKNISDFDVSIEGLEIIKTEQAENPNYLFVTVETKNSAPGKFDILFKKKGKEHFLYQYELKQREENSAQRKGFDASDAIYLLMPDRFANGNPENDSVMEMAEKADRNNPDGRHGGDIKGIIDHLDYLDDLGVTAIWSTPLLEDSEPIYSYHTYAQSDYYKIDPRYGTNEDYKMLADELHNRDMKLIMDYVTNHWGSKHWIIEDLPSIDWIHYWHEGKDGFKRSNYRMSTQFDSHASQTDAVNCMDGWFDVTMPDMNQANTLLRNYMVQNAIWWIEYAGLDGLRIDTYSYNDKDGIAKWTKAIMEEYPNFNIVGEVWMHNQAQIAYWQKDSKIASLQDYNSHLPSVMDFTLHDALMVMFSEEEGWDRGLQRAYDNFTNDFLYPSIDNILVFVGNHDTERINQIYGKDLDKFKLAMALILTIRGIPQLYYGDEIGMMGAKENGDGDLRKDFPGGWANDPQSAFTQNGRTDTQNSYHNFLKKILNWRKSKAVMHTGKFLHYVPQENVYVYFRHNDSEAVMVILNNSKEPKSISAERFSEGLKGAKTGTDIISEKKISFSEQISIPAKTSMIVEINR